MQIRKFWIAQQKKRNQEIAKIIKTGTKSRRRLNVCSNSLKSSLIKENKTE